MGYLESIFPRLKNVNIPFSRDQLMLLMAAVNEIILGADIYLAHSISGTIVPYEWIPIIFGPAAGIILLAAGLLALRRRGLATVLATGVFLASIVIGALGSYFHLQRAVLQDAPFGQQISLDLLVWAPPIFGPIAFAGVGLLGLSAAWIEDPTDSGTLRLLRGRKLHMPTSKTRGYLFLVSLGILAALVSSVFDHARTGFENPWLWLPTAVGVFATVVTAVVASSDQPTRQDLLTFIWAMGLMIVVGLIGAWLHIQTDLTAEYKFVQERFLRGAPFLAPLQFCNLAGLGIIALLNPKEG